VAAVKTGNDPLLRGWGCHRLIGFGRRREFFLKNGNVFLPGFRGAPELSLRGELETVAPGLETKPVPDGSVSSILAGTRVPPCAKCDI